MDMNYGLEGKTAIVTGGGRGIGKAIALGLAESGVKLLLTARSEDQLDQVVAEIKEAGGEAQSLACDLTAEGQIDNVVKAAVDAYGRVDILVNNAARSFMRSLMDLREDGWDKIFDTNCKALFLLSRAAAKIMMDQGGGHIINISTVGAVRGGSGMGAYHASKSAVNMLTKCMAVEWAQHNINVNAVGPGLTKTPFSQPIWSNPAVEKSITSRIPKGRLAEPEEIVGAVLFLCSEGSSFITGQTLYVDGGTLAS